MHSRPRKRFGQNFLTDASIIDRIVAAIDPAENEPMIEIGPGRGALTGPLIAAGADLHVVEIDRDLAAALPVHVPGLGADHIHLGDALQLDLAALLPAVPNDGIRVVGNLPYNISTPLLMRLMDMAGLIRDMHFMLQSEVVNRMAADPGGKTYGRLSIMCQYRCAVVPLFTVPPEAFDPPPRVQSGFVRLVPHRQPPVQIADTGLFERIVARAFSKRRKTLRNSLKGLLEEDLIREAGIDPALRAEALDLEDYASLTRVMAHYDKREPQ